MKTTEANGEDIVPKKIKKKTKFIGPYCHVEAQ